MMVEHNTNEIKVESTLESLKVENMELEGGLTNQSNTLLNNESPVQKNMVLDTSNFIRLKPLDNLNEGWRYYTTDFIVKEIRDEKAREFYERNKQFVTVKNPSRETMKFITNFAKISNDLKNLSIPDLSILSLAYDLIKENGQDDLVRKEPIKCEVVEIEEKIYYKKKVVKEVEAPSEPLEEGFKEVKSKKKNKIENSSNNKNFEDEGEWITPENIDSKLGKYKLEKSEEESKISTFISTGDFTVQNLAMKMGMPVLGVDGMKIRKIKNYILKCYSCNYFLFDTSKLFCEDCGYSTLMKIGCSMDSSGKMKIYNKKAEPRNRGTQYDLPKPSLSKKGVIYILSEDQLPKKRHEYNLERDLEKILDNYESYKDFNPYKIGEFKQNTTKQFVWGVPKKNPNVAKKLYGKKQKK